MRRRKRGLGHGRVISEGGDAGRRGHGRATGKGCAGGGGLVTGAEAWGTGWEEALAARQSMTSQPQRSSARAVGQAIGAVATV